MKRTVLLHSLIMILFLCAGSPKIGRTQEDESYKNHPGYVDLSSVPDLGETESTVEIFLTPGLAKLMGAMEEGDRAAEDLFSGLKLIKVYTFDTKANDRSRLAHKIDELSKKLVSGKWERFLRAKDKSGRAEIFTKSEDKKLQGVVVLSMDDEEAAFVNIVGTMDFETLGKLSKKFDIPELDTLKAKQ